MKFHYQARTKKGEIQTGIIEASSKEAAITVLQRYGLYVTYLKEAEKAVPFYARRIKFLERISRKDLLLFSRQLSIMFAAKVSLVESLRTLAHETKNPTFREKIINIYDMVEGGTSFSSALAKHSEIFSPFYIAMVKSGEVSGKLSEVLHYLADHLESEYHLISRVRGAMIYPALVFLVVILVLGLIIFFIIPQLSIVFEAQPELPMITKILLALADFLKKWILIFILIFLIIIAALFKYYKTKAGKEFFDQFFLKLPFLGTFLKLIYLSRIAENLSTLISAGLPIGQCLEITGNIVGNIVYQGILFQTRDEVRRGEQISRVLARFPETFPPVFTQVILVGETTGTLEKTLMQLVSFYQKEIERMVESFFSILEPLMIVFLGVVVGGLVVGFLIPIYQMAGAGF